MKVDIYWITKNQETIRRIREHFGITRGMTINGENTLEVDEKGLSELKELDKRGLIQLRIKKRL